MVITLTLGQGGDNTPRRGSGGSRRGTESSSADGESQGGRLLRHDSKDVREGVDERGQKHHIIYVEDMVLRVLYSSE